MYYIIFAVLIGILIGAFTNHLAIKMLFRPYSAWKIAKWNVPFTPGLFPKRKAELARSLGLIVENYLFTATGMKEFVQKSDLRDQIFTKLINDIGKYKERDIKISEGISALFKDDWQSNLRVYKNNKFSEMINNEKIRNKTLKDILSEETLNNIDGKFDYLSEYIIDLVKDYLLTIEGKRKIRSLINQLFNQSGTVGFLAGLFMDIDQINDKTLTYLNQILEKDETQKSISKILLNSWDKIKDESLGSWIDKFDDTLKTEIDNLFNKVLDYLNNSSTSDLLTRLEENKFIEKIYDIAITLIVENLDKLFGYLSISNVVEAEVNNFSTAYLEKMILEISGRELKMITYFGGLIGGLIGLFQGIIAIFF